MARGPFQGTWNPNLRPTVVTAPDAVVYINGESDVIGCANCRRHFDFNRYITSIQVDLSVDSVPGSASISLSIPRHAIDDFYFDGVPVLTPMMEIEIYAKGYYLVEGMPQYYPIFWGLIGDVSDSYSSGEHTVSISCFDILKWWELCRMNVNPAMTGPTANQERSIFGNTFFGKNPYDTIWTLAQQSFGDVIIGTGSLISIYREERQKAAFNAAMGDIMLYWTQRFQKIRSNLLLYGVNGVAVRGDSLIEKYKTAGKNKPGNFTSDAVAMANGAKRKADGTLDTSASGQMVFDPTDPAITAFRTQFSQAPAVNFWQSEYQTKLELANAAKEAIGFEFYMDVDGSIVFKPPFYNLDVIGNKPVSWIQDIDVIDWGLSESEAEVVTQITLQGSFGGNVEYSMPEEATPFTSVTDYHLLRKYGWRPETYNSEFMSSPILMFYHGLDILDRKNSRRHRGTVSIPLRPELRLGFPVYLASKDQVWYVSGISHSIAFGGRAQTTLTLTARRSKFIAPNGMGQVTHTGFAKGSTRESHPGGAAFPYNSKSLSNYGTFDLQVGEAASMPPIEAAGQTVSSGEKDPYEPILLRHPKTGRILGYPNVVMVYTRPFAPTADQLAAVSGQSRTKPYIPPQYQKGYEEFAKQQGIAFQKQMVNVEADAVTTKVYSNRYQYGLNSAGVYIYAHEGDSPVAKTAVIGEMLLLQTSNITTRSNGSLLASSGQKGFFEGGTAMIRPVSDARGFEVIGHFRYGRGVALRDGQLVLNNGEVNKKASVNLQLSLSGGLYETLTAQSQGLSTVQSAYSNPVEAVSRLMPEDTQTAGVVTPDTKEPRVSDGGAKFVDAAPLGSAKQQGLPSSVEASQLSRALTLAEMTVKDGQTIANQDCACLLGRGDLAFITNGYQFKLLNPAAPAPDLFTNTSNQVSALRIASGGEAMSSRVTKFLTDLYEALDGPHMDYEEQLRSGGLPQTIGETTNDLQGPAGALGDLTPPFSAPDRYALGDTSALLGQISSAKQDLAQSWSGFGAKLKANAERARIASQLSQEKADLAKLQQQRASAEKLVGQSHNVTVGQKSPADTVQDLDAQIAKLSAQIATDEMALQQAQNAVNTASTGG